MDALKCSLCVDYAQCAISSLTTDKPCDFFVCDYPRIKAPMVVGDIVNDFAKDFGMSDF